MFCFLQCLCIIIIATGMISRDIERCLSKALWLKMERQEHTDRHELSIANILQILLNQSLVGTQAEASSSASINNVPTAWRGSRVQIYSYSSRNKYQISLLKASQMCRLGRFGSLEFHTISVIKRLRYFCIGFRLKPWKLLLGQNQSTGQFKILT